jgi:hypothetical protein
MTGPITPMNQAITITSRTPMDLERTQGHQHIVTLVRKKRLEF